MSSRLVFSEGRHTYALDGERVPGVTTVINRATDKPQLVYASAREAATWAAHNMDALAILGPDAWIRQAAGAPRSVWDGKARRGSLLHEAARQLVRGDPLTPTDEDGVTWPDDVVRSAQQLARFMDEWDVEPILSERPVFHSEHRWAGTIDLVATVKGGLRWLLDYKTGETGIYPKDSLQLAAYRHATHVQVVDPAAEGGLEDQLMPKVDRVGCVWVRPDGYEVRPVRADVVTYQLFLHMIPVARWSALPREDSVGEPLPIPEGVAS
jgi:hypothetical protein